MDRIAIKDLKEKRANVWSQANELLEQKNDDWTAEDQSTWDNYNSELDALSGQIERSEKLLGIDTKFEEIDDKREEETGTPKDQYKETFDRYMKRGMSALEESDKQTLLRGFVPNTADEQRALSVGTDSAGGYTVPEGFWNKITETMKAYGGVQEVSNVITTATGQNLPWMTNNDTTNVGAILAENTQISEQDVVFGTKSLGAYLYTSNLIRVSYQLMQDSAIDIESFLARKMGERLGRIHNQHQTTGTGSSQPQGVVTGATTGKTTASATAITFEEIVDLVHSIDPAYRAAGRPRFMFHDSILAYLRKIKDDSGGAGVGRPLWEPSVQVGEPSTIYGYPYTVNQDMASTVATTNTTALFGDFNAGYIVRRVKDVSVLRLDERYADYLQVGWFAYDRQDSIVDDANAFKALVQA